jgi:molybdopterin molybdotransferase
MGCCDVKGLMPIDLALTKMQAELTNVCQSITLPLSQALGAVLAQDILSPLNVPPFNNSAMDGYALSHADLNICSCEQPIVLKEVGCALAGSPYIGDIPRGCCVRIMTGAVLPTGVDTVVMQEQVSVSEEQLTFTRSPKFGDNVRLVGEDVMFEQRVLKQGHRLTPRDIPLLASLGLETLQVFRKLKVAVLSSGDELKSLGEPLNTGELYDSNRYSMIALLSRLNVEVIDLGIIKDDKSALKEAFIKADQQADVVISSGGVSVGEADFIKEVLAELGTISFWKLAIKPGKPFAFGHLPNSVFFGLPGNPVSALVTLYQLAVPAMEKLSGMAVKSAMRFTAIMQDDIRKKAGRTDFQRGLYFVDKAEQIVVQSTGKQGSGIFSSMCQSNCFIVLEQDRGNVMAGERVTIEPYTHLLD